jgi:hypothetical protein
MKNFATQDALNEIERDMKQQGRGSTFIDVNETGRRLLRIKPSFPGAEKPPLVAWSPHAAKATIRE